MSLKLCETCRSVFPPVVKTRTYLTPDEFVPRFCCIVHQTSFPVWVYVIKRWSKDLLKQVENFTKLCSYIDNPDCVTYFGLLLNAVKHYVQVSHAD